MLTAGAVIDAEGGSYLERLHDARNIIGLRNQVIHAYDSFSDENIYALLIHHLLILEEDNEWLFGEDEEVADEDVSP